MCVCCNNAWACTVHWGKKNPGVGSPMLGKVGRGIALLLIWQVMFGPRVNNLLLNPPFFFHSHSLSNYFDPAINDDDEAGLVIISA